MAKTVKAASIPDLNKQFTPSLLGEVIKAKRTQSHITQADAAALCGIAKQTYIKIEQGSSDVKLSSLMQVIEALGVRLTIEPWFDTSKSTKKLGDSDDDIWV